MKASGQERLSYNDAVEEALCYEWMDSTIRNKREWGLRKLGIYKDLARLTSYCGNRYYFVATKTCEVKAISKEKLTLKGLVSPLDYYN